MHDQLKKKALPWIPIICIVGVVLGCNGYDIIDLGVMVSSDTILSTAQHEGADIIGISGLITPSLDEMVYVAKEMERLGFNIPLLIGGATTSRKHTAVKIEENYSGATVHVIDASRAVGVVRKLMNSDEKETFIDEIKSDFQNIRKNRNKKKLKPPLSLETARQRKLSLDWSTYSTEPLKVCKTSFSATCRENPRCTPASIIASIKRKTYAGPVPESAVAISR